MSKIAIILQKSRSGLYSELKRNTVNGKAYDAISAQKLADERASNKGNVLKINNRMDVLQFISRQILEEHKSVESISHELLEHNMPNLSVKTIYSYIDKNIVPGVSRDNLKSNMTTMYSDGIIRIPNHIRKQANIADGDSFEVQITDTGIFLNKVAMARNVNKLHNKIQNNKTGTHLFPLKRA